MGRFNSWEQVCHDINTQTELKAGFDAANWRILITDGWKKTSFPLPMGNISPAVIGQIMVRSRDDIKRQWREGALRGVGV